MINPTVNNQENDFTKFLRMHKTFCNKELQKATDL